MGGWVWPMLPPIVVRNRLGPIVLSCSQAHSWVLGQGNSNGAALLRFDSQLCWILMFNFCRISDCCPSWWIPRHTDLWWLTTSQPTAPIRVPSIVNHAAALSIAVCVGCNPLRGNTSRETGIPHLDMVDFCDLINMIRSIRSPIFSSFLPQRPKAPQSLFQKVVPMNFHLKWWIWV